jgi:tetratricopeptide (TPR) repeat protein
MPAWTRLVAALLLCAGAAPAQASAARCGGDAWELAAAAERALQRGDWPGSARLYGCAAAGSEDPALAERATRTAFENAQYPEAVRQARRWLAIQPANESARRHLATGLLRLYDDAGAAAEFGQLLATAYEDRARGHMVLLGILAEEGNETGAARVMERLATADAGVAEAQYAASVLWERAEDGGRALAAARRAIALRKDWRLAELAEVRALAARGEEAAALERVATLAADGDLYTRISHAWLLLGAERRDEAAAIFEELRRAGGAAAGDAIAGLTAIALDERRFDDARRLQDEAARDAQQADAVQWNLARIAEERGEQAGAARHYERIKGGARAVPAQLRAWRLWRAQGLPERAEMLLDDFLADEPGETRDVVAGVASLLVEDGSGDAAIALMDRALAVLPDDDLRVTRGFLLERLDRVAEAVAEMRGVLHRRPEDPVIQNALGYTLVDRTRSLQEGRRLIERALAAKPDSYAVQDSMGWALVRLGRLEEGRSWLETAWQRSEDPEVAAHLGETYWLLGRVDDARRLWDETLAKHPDSRPLLRAIERHPR